ncbi:hypothetical protein ACRQ5D_24770 [Mucilaginibacter sp. P25]|uniref:Type II CBASS E2 protein domain-containing protein n=1 Tax=Mucilaginibacter gossypii TaxID=551996 RepID=A0A1G7TPX7_9SPHI|nr:hypothetical protein [Mucilaginibacter gossypii]SDG37383.1 hypothetical protein SAMN05192573_103232 [Mucilaginibacter gossypii]
MGAKKLYLPFKGINPIKVLFNEKYLLEKAYDFLNVAIRGNTLFAVGFCQPSEYSAIYRYKLRFTPGLRPKVFTCEPRIIYNNDIHMYSSDHSLCLYYPKDYSFTSLSNLYNTIIPWTHEWYLYYELYLLKGKWLHPYVDHKKI